MRRFRAIWDGLVRAATHFVRRTRSDARVDEAALVIVGTGVLAEAFFAYLVRKAVCVARAVWLWARVDRASALVAVLAIATLVVRRTLGDAAPNLAFWGAA